MKFAIRTIVARRKESTACRPFSVYDSLNAQASGETSEDCHEESTRGECESGNQIDLLAILIEKPAHPISCFQPDKIGNRTCYPKQRHKLQKVAYPI